MDFKIVFVFFVICGIFLYLYYHPGTTDEIQNIITKIEGYLPTEEKVVPVHYETVSISFLDINSLPYNDDDLKIIVVDVNGTEKFNGYNDGLSRVVLHDVWTDVPYTVSVRTGFSLGRVYSLDTTFTILPNTTITVDRMAFLKSLNIRTRNDEYPQHEDPTIISVVHNKPKTFLIDIGLTGDGVLKDVGITFNGTPTIIDAWVWVYDNVGVDVKGFNTDKLTLNTRHPLGDLIPHKSATLALQIERISQGTELQIVVDDVSGIEHEEATILFV